MLLAGSAQKISLRMSSIRQPLVLKLSRLPDASDENEIKEWLLFMCLTETK